MNLRFISPAVHGVLDYVVAFSLVVAPFLLHFLPLSPLAFWLSVAAGAGLAAYSLMTNYPDSLVKFIPFKTHLLFDFSAGAVFVLTALLAGLTGTPFVFFMVMGLAVMAVVLVTDPAVRHVPATA